VTLGGAPGLGRVAAGQLLDADPGHRGRDTLGRPDQPGPLAQAERLARGPAGQEHPDRLAARQQWDRGG
jgi:hypothetical protein